MEERLALKKQARNDRNKILDKQINTVTLVENSTVLLTPIFQNCASEAVKVNRLVSLLVWLSIFDYFCFALPFGMMSIIETQCQFSFQKMLMSIAFSFCFPTQWIAPFTLNRWFFKCPKCFIITMRTLLALSIGFMIWSFYAKNYWLFAFSRMFHLKFLVGSRNCTNHLIRVCEKLHKKQTGGFIFFISELSVNNIAMFMFGAVLLRQCSSTWSPLFFSSWLVFGIQCFALCLTICLSVMIKNFQIDKNQNFEMLIKSDEPLTKHEKYENAINQNDEEYKYLTAEQKYSQYNSHTNFYKEKVGNEGKTSAIIAGYGSLWKN